MADGDRDGDKFLHPNLVICEGKLDVTVLRKLFEVKQIAGFDLIFSGNNQTGGGIDKLGQKLKAIKINEQFIQVVERIFIVADNDDGNALNRVKRQLRDVSDQVPNEVHQFSRFAVEDGKEKQIAIHLLPDSEFGCLETILVKSALGKWPDLREPLAAYKNHVPARGWSVTDQAKMELECLVASTCHEQPDVQILWLWQKRPEFHIPLDSPDFDSLVQFLTMRSPPRRRRIQV
jgi:hypothetical protein